MISLERPHIPFHKNQVPENRRNSMWNQDSYQTGEIRDGHVIERYYDEDAAYGEAFDLICPVSCCRPETFAGWGYYDMYGWGLWSKDNFGFDNPPYDLPYEFNTGPDQCIPAMEATEVGLMDLYEGGREEAEKLASKMLGGEKHHIVWSFSSGGSWTDYGWEYDAEFSWRIASD